MKTRLIYTLALAGLWVSTTTFAADNERHITLQEDIASAQLVRLDFAAGDVEITGINGNKLTADLTATCEDEGKEDCRQLLKQLDWAKKKDSTFELGLSPAAITHYNHTSIKIKVGVPKDKKLAVSLSAGELNIKDTSGCLSAEVNAGEMNISLNENQLASATLSAKVGDVKLKLPKGDEIAGERSMLVGASLDWVKGPGSCHTQASVLTGEANLLLK